MFELGLKPIARAVVAATDEDLDEFLTYYFVEMDRSAARQQSVWLELGALAELLMANEKNPNLLKGEKMQKLPAEPPKKKKIVEHPRQEDMATPAADSPKAKPEPAAVDGEVIACPCV